MLHAVPYVDSWMFAGLTALAFLTAAMGTVAGLGGGVLLLGVMATVFPPAALIPLHGVIQLGSNVSRVTIMHRYVLRSAMVAAGIGALLGAAIGGELVVSLPTALLEAILGGFLLYVCWSPRITVGEPTRRRFFVLGAVGTLISMFVGATGSLLSPFVAGVSPDRRVFVATLAAMMIMVHGLKVVTFGLLGFAFAAYLPLLAAMIAAGYFGNWAGKHLLDRMPEALFRRIFQIALTLLAVRLLYAAATKAGYL
jgi:uncharacterized protein